MRAYVWFVMSALVAISCGENPRVGFDQQAINRSLDERNQQAEARCGCPDVRRDSSLAACLVAQGAVKPGQRDCLLQVDGRYGADVSRFAGCMLTHDQELSRCLKDDGCSDACSHEHVEARAECLKQFPLPEALPTEESFCFEEKDQHGDSEPRDMDAGLAKPMADKSSAGAGGQAGARSPARMSSAGSPAGSSSMSTQAPPASGCAHELEVNHKVSIPTTWSHGAGDCDYLVRGVLGISSALTIEPGTILTFVQDASVTIESGGQLIAVGAPDKRIHLFGQNDVNGYWNSVQFLSGSRESKLEYVDIRNAGQTGSESWKYGRAIGGTGAITFKHNRISRSYAAGANFADTLILQAFENNVFEDNLGYGLVIGYNQVRMLDAASDYVGKDKPNGFPYIFAKWDDDLHVASVWKNVGTPFFYNITLNVNAPLTLEPGVQLVANGGAAIEVSNRGSLTAIGTQNSPVVFTSEMKKKGAWTGLVFYETSSDQNKLQHVRIEYAGDGGRIGGHRAAIELISVSVSTQVTVTDSTISDCAGYPVCLQTDVREPTFNFENVMSIRNDYDKASVCN